MKWDLLINPIFGGIIGYGTNYLAIKMLFRPHKTLYIGKMKVPFTPGLIPKEKATLAHQMGQITEDFLLTEEMLVDTLTNNKAKEIFLGFLNEIPNDVQDAIIEQLTLEIVTILKSKKVIDLAVPYVIEEMSKVVSKDVKKGMDNGSIAEHLKRFGQQTLEGDLAKLHIYNVLEELEQKTYAMLQANSKQIGKSIISAVGEGEEARKIKETLEHWVEENFNPMVSMFINIDKIYEGIIKFASEALEDEERNSKFGHFLCTVAKGLKQSEPSYKEKVINIIKDQINDHNIELIIKVIIEELRENQEQTKAQINQFIYKKWVEYVNTQGFFETTKKALEQMGKTIKANPQISEKVFGYYAKIIESNSNSVAKMMDISNLVETRINQFSSQEAEKVILSVVKKQLKGITWIGALLGAIIGVFSNFIG